MADVAKHPSVVPHGHSYEVTHQEFSDHYGADGKRNVVGRIHFRTPSGVTAHVELPDTHYTAENAHALISAKTAEIEKVAALNGTAPPHTH